MAQKPRLTEAEHRALGPRFKQVSNDVRDIRNVIARAFPKTSPIARRADRAVQALEDLRSSLDDEAFGAIYFDDADDSKRIDVIRIYYGAKDDASTPGNADLARS